MTNDVTPFDYTSLTTTIQQEVRAAAERIKIRMKRTGEDIIEIGRDLKFSKSRLGHGNFLSWIDAEFGLAERTAQNFMKVTDKFGDKSANFADLSPSVLYLLTSASPEVIEPVETKLAEGEKVDLKEINRLKQELAQKDQILKASSANERKLMGEKDVLEEQAKSLTKAIADARETATRDAYHPV